MIRCQAEASGRVTPRQKSKIWILVTCEKKNQRFYIITSYWALFKINRNIYYESTQICSIN